MDLKSILPLMAMSNGGKANADKLSAITDMLGGEKPDIAKVMSMMPTKKTQPSGLKPILSFAGYDIIGRLASYFARK